MKKIGHGRKFYIVSVEKVAYIFSRNQRQPANKMKIPHTSILTSFTATETFESPCGRGHEITVHTLTRDNNREKFWRYTATSFKTFKDGFDAPKMRRECWDDSTASDMIERFKTGERCQCATAD